MQTKSKDRSFLNDLFWCFLSVIFINFVAIPLFMFDITNTTTEFVGKSVFLTAIAYCVYKVINYLSTEKS